MNTTPNTTLNFTTDTSARRPVSLVERFREPVPVLDHGFVRLVDVMGDDTAVVDAARVSYGAGTSRTSDNRNLIRYLMRHRHTSPFEQCEIKLHLKMPIFVARQWIRHRTASLNEVSGRYSVINDEFYTPGDNGWRTQSTVNKQGSEGVIKDSDLYESDAIGTISRSTICYKSMIEGGVSREQARIVLPLSTYTEFYWKIDLHNLLHFLSLRMDDHAQQEIRVFAEAIATIVARWVPETWEAFEDYRLHAMTLTRLDIAILSAKDNHSAMDMAHAFGWLKKSSRERVEFESKAARLGVGVPWQDANLE